MVNGITLQWSFFYFHLLTISKTIWTVYLAVLRWFPVFLSCSFLWHLSNSHYSLRSRILDKNLCVYPWSNSLHYVKLLVQAIFLMFLCNMIVCTCTFISSKWIFIECLSGVDMLMRNSLFHGQVLWMQMLVEFTSMAGC